MALKGWLGPNGADQDFRFDDYWYEIKTSEPGSLTICISSLEQLDNDSQGQLCIVLLDRAGGITGESFSLNSLVERIRNSISNDAEAKDMFEQRMDLIGYIDSKEYSDDILKNQELIRHLSTFSRFFRYPLLHEL